MHIITSLRNWIQDCEIYERTGRRRRPFVRFITQITRSQQFQIFIISVVILNAITIGDETRVIAMQRHFHSSRGYQYLNLIYMCIYIAEFSMRVYAQPVGYWRDSYSVFDAGVMALSVIQWIVQLADFRLDSLWVRFLTALRVIRLIRVFGFIPSLKVVVNALLHTLRHNVVDILILLFITMFIFGILGHYLFGQDSTQRSYEDYGSLPDSFMTLFIYVCGDGWLPYHDKLISDGYRGSEFFSAIFFFIGGLIIANLFVGVICQNISDATKADRAEKQKKRKMAKTIKQGLFLRKQRKDMIDLIAETTTSNKNFQDLLKEKVGTLRHEDVVPITHVACNLTWLETFAVTLTHQENTMYRCQQLHFGIANTLAEYGKLVSSVSWDIFYDSPQFQFFIISIVVANAVTIGDEARVISGQPDFHTSRVYQYLNLIYMCIYIAEFFMRLYVHPLGYWKDSYNVFDAGVMALSVVQWIVQMAEFHLDLPWVRILASLRVIRLVRIFNFIPSLKVVVNALLYTLRSSVFDILVLLFIIMFIFGILGHYLFGQISNQRSYQDWGTLGNAFMTLFIYVCNIADATKADNLEKEKKRKIAKMIKRELFLRKQRQDMSELVAQTAKSNRNFQDIMQDMVGALSHDDIVPMTHITCNLTWLETFAVTLTHQENTMYRCQQLHFAIAETLAEYMDRRLKSRLKQER
ncbi:Cation channel sperm-associated protein 3 [Dinochytrium kinnereticum]|nr:Cation channel sperm-associated protein 3 [Dinochytrium kinnereticum]